MPALTFVMFFHTQVHLCTYIHQYTEKKQTPKSSTQSKAVITINFHAMGNLLSHLLRVHMNCTQDHLLKWNRTIPEYSTLVFTLIQQNGHWAQVYLGPGPLIGWYFFQNVLFSGSWVTVSFMLYQSYFFSTPNISENCDVAEDHIVNSNFNHCDKSWKPLRHRRSRDRNEPTAAQQPALITPQEIQPSFLCSC